MIYLASRSPRRLELLRQIGIEPRLLLDDDEARAEALETVQPGESPTRYVERVTRAKAEAARARLEALAGATPATASARVAVAAGITGITGIASAAGVAGIAGTAGAAGMTGAVTVAAASGTAAGDGAPSGWPLLPLLAADTTVAIGGRILGKPADADDARRILGELSGRSHRVLTSIAVISASGRRHWQRTQVSRVLFMRLRPADIDAYIATGEPFGKAGAYGIQGAAARFVRRIEGSYSGIMGLPLHECALLLQKAGWRPGDAAPG